MNYTAVRFTTRPITFGRTNNDKTRSAQELVPAGTKVFVSEKANAKGFHVARVAGTLLTQYVRPQDFTEVGTR